MYVSAHSPLCFATLLGCALLAACSSSSDSSGAAGSASAQTCWPTDASCMLPEKAGFECLALADNASSQNGRWLLRMSQLQIAKPTVLAGKFLQDTVVSKSISMAMPQCLQEGNGRFNWLLEFDWQAAKLHTGGAHLTKTPKQGYCYINQTIDGFLAQPADIDLQTGTEGQYLTFSTKANIPTFNVPIFLDDQESTSLMMPLHDVSLTEGRIAPDHNCIGSWDGDGLTTENNCKPDPELGQRMQWKNGARLSAYITLEEADKVWIPDLTQTLCVALSGDPIKYAEDFEEGGRKGKRCKRNDDGRILVAELADWCAATNQACASPQADAFRLEGQFAASAVRLSDSCP